MLTLPDAAPGRLAARNPVAKLVAAALPGLVLVLTLDAVTPAVVLALTLLAVPASGVPASLLLRRAWPLLVAAGGVGLVNALVGTQAGPLLLALGPLEVTRPDALTALGISLRVLGVALPGVLVLAATDPVDLADSLVQQARLPARLAYGVLAALRLLPLLSADWASLARARRARGLQAEGPLDAVRLFAGQVLGLLVVALRRATRVAEAMDARGFAAAGPRTSARVQRVTAADVALVAASALGCALAVTTSVRAGAWQPLLSVLG